MLYTSGLQIPMSAGGAEYRLFVVKKLKKLSLRSSFGQELSHYLEGAVVWHIAFGLTSLTTEFLTTSGS